VRSKLLAIAQLLPLDRQNCRYQFVKLQRFRVFKNFVSFGHNSCENALFLLEDFVYKCF
jgi:hypothetical protein